MRKLTLVALLFWCPLLFAGWTAKPLSKEVVDGKLVVFVGYTDGTTVLTRYHRIDTYEQFLSEVKAEIARLDGVDAALLKVTVGALIDTGTKPPSQEEIDRNAFMGLIRIYQAKLGELKAGVGGTSQSDVDTAIANIKAAYKPEYAPFLVGLF